MSNDPADQLSIVQQMNSALSSQQQLLQGISDSLEKQFQFQVRNASSADDINEGIKGQSKNMSSLLGIQTQMILATDKLNTLYTRSEAMLKNSNREMSAMGALFRTIGADSFVMFDNMLKKNKFLNGSLGSTINISRDIVSIVQRRGELQKQINDALAEGNAELVESLTKQSQLTTLTGALSVVQTAFSGMTSVISGFFDITKSFISYTIKGFKQIMKLPMTLFNTAAEIGSTLKTEVVENIGNAIQETKEFFDLTSSIGKNFNDLKNPVKDNTNLLLEFRDISGDLVKTFGEGVEGYTSMIQKTAETISGLGPLSNIFGSTINKSIESVLFFEKATKNLGLSTEDFVYFATESLASGKSLTKIFLDLSKQTSKTAKEFGVDRKVLSKEFLVLRKDIINFGNLSSDHLLKITAGMNQLGLSTKEAQNIFNKLDTFEDASNMAANLSQAFGITVDAYTMITENDPSKIIMNLRDSLFATGKSFQNMERHERGLLQQYTGLSAEALNIVFNFENAGMSYKKLQEQMEDSSPQAKQLKAIKSVTSSIKELQKVVENKTMFETFTKGFETVIKYNTKLGKTYQTASENMGQFYKDIIKLGLDPKMKGSIDTLLSPITKIFDTLNQSFTSTKFKKIFQSAITTLASVSEKAINVQGKSLRQVSVEMGKDLDAVSDGISNSLKGGPLKAFSDIGKQIGDVIRIAGTLGPQVIIKINDFFRGVNTGESPFAKFLGLTQKEIDDINHNFGEAFNKLFKGDGLITKGISLLKESMIEVASTAADVFVEGIAVGLNDIIQDSFLLRHLMPGADMINRRALMSEGRSTNIDINNPLLMKQLATQLIGDLRGDRGSAQESFARGSAINMLEQIKQRPNVDGEQVQSILDKVANNNEFTNANIHDFIEILNQQKITQQLSQENMNEGLLMSSKTQHELTNFMYEIVTPLFTGGVLFKVVAGGVLAATASLPAAIAAGLLAAVGGGAMTKLFMGGLQDSFGSQEAVKYDNFNDGRAELMHPNGKVSKFNSADAFLAYRTNDVIHQAFSSVALDTKEVKANVINMQKMQIEEINALNNNINSMRDTRVKEESNINLTLKPQEIILNLDGQKLATVAGPEIVKQISDPRNGRYISEDIIFDRTFGSTSQTSVIGTL